MFTAELAMCTNISGIIILRRKSLVSTDTVCNNFDSLNIVKNLTKNKIHVMSYKCEHFQQNIPKIYPFSSSKIHKAVNIKIQIS